MSAPLQERKRPVKSFGRFLLFAGGQGKQFAHRRVDNVAVIDLTVGLTGCANRPDFSEATTVVADGCDNHTAALRGLQSAYGFSLAKRQGGQGFARLHGDAKGEVSSIRVVLNYEGDGCAAGQFAGNFLQRGLDVLDGGCGNSIQMNRYDGGKPFQV